MVLDTTRRYLISVFSTAKNIPRKTAKIKIVKLNCQTKNCQKQEIYEEHQNSG